MTIPAAVVLFTCLQSSAVDLSRVVQAVQSTAHDWKWWEVWGGSGFKMPAEGGEISAWVYFENDRMSMCSPTLTFCTSYIVNQDHDWVGGSNRKTPVAGTLEDLKSYLQAFDDAAARTSGVYRLPSAGQSPSAGGSPTLSTHIRLDPPVRKGSFHNVRVKVPRVERKPAETHEWASEMLQSAAFAAVRWVQTSGTVVIPRMDWAIRRPSCWSRLRVQNRWCGLFASVQCRGNGDLGGPSRTIRNWLSSCGRKSHDSSGRAFRFHKRTTFT